jgi:tRNA(Arg) A34 adenosine deaminase TadA
MNPMHRAIDLSKMGLLYGRPFGAVVVRDSEIIGEGFDRVVPLRDPTAHAPILAMREACRRLKTPDLSGCELHSSCEPCPMCLCAMHWGGIGKAFYAVGRTNAAAAGFEIGEAYRQMGLPHAERRIETVQAMDPERIAAMVVLANWNNGDD